MKAKEFKFVWPKINKVIEKAVLRQLNQEISIYDGRGIFVDFEKQFAARHKRPFAVLCSSGTAAIHSMFIAANLHSGDEVICPAYTFFATVTPLLFTGAKPILCDCDANGNIDPNEIVNKITKRTKAVVVTHMWGIPAEMDKIKTICKRHKILLLEDCSHAHGAEYHGKLVGSFGDLAAWSLQGSKNITGGEGGIMLTSNRNFYERALLLGHYNKRCLKDINSRSQWSKYAVTGMGLKYRAHPLAVAIARQIFLNDHRYSNWRRRYARKIIVSLRYSNKVSLPPAYFDDRISPSWYALIFLLKDGNSKSNHLSGILDQSHRCGLVDVDHPGSTIPLNLLPLFQKPATLFPVYRGCNSFSYKPGDFPNAEKFSASLIKIPVGVDRHDGFLVNIYCRELKKILS